ncbi:MAG: tRNA pseudouridine(55) synthase TruB [Gammaproteobacteria bacterium]
MTDGVLLLDKPLGLSSTAAGLRVRRLLRAAKAGHVGSLDPLATGMLPICIGEATKVAGEILEGRKVYRFTVALGARTATGDVEGEVVERAPVPAFDEVSVRAAMQGFLGATRQVPPMYSAIKQGGQPLYKLARAGQVVERKPRVIQVDAYEPRGIEWDGVGLPAALDCRVTCSKGTYVRVLAEDLSRTLGTVGHVSALRRERVEPFDPSRLVTLEAIEAAAQAGAVAGLPWLSPDEVLGHLPAVDLDPEGQRRLLHGQPVAVSTDGWQTGQRLRLRGSEGAFLGLGAVSGPGRVAPKRLVARQVNE